MMQDVEQTNDKEEIKQEVEEYDFSKPNFMFIPSGNHQWSQQGYYAICHSCELQHAIFIGKDKMLVGIKEGKPVFKTRKELGMV